MNNGKWFIITSFTCCGIVVLFMLYLIIETSIHPPAEKPCSAFRNYPIRELPARCVKEFSPSSIE